LIKSKRLCESKVVSQKKNSIPGFSEFKKRFNYRSFTDDDVFKKLVHVVFYSGMRASTVTKKIERIESYFSDFRRVKDYSKKEIDQILEDPETIHNKLKIDACVHNAKKLDELVNQYGSFQKYLEVFEPFNDEANIERLKKDLIRRFEFLGKITVNHFLTDLGFDVIKPDRVICRIFERLGLINNRKDIDQAIEVAREMSAATGHPIRYIDIILVNYGMVGEHEKFRLKGGICLEKTPKCHECGVREYCVKYTTNNKTMQTKLPL